MAESIGLVQRLSILTDTITCVWIGPTPDNTEILLVSNDGSAADANFASSMIHVLASASTNYREVVAVHGDSDATVTSVRLEPI
jgi:hypothetical protein